jgi:hypothetical protein
MFSLSLYKMCSIFFSFFLLHASRLMFLVVQLTLLNIGTTSKSSHWRRRKRRCGERNIYIHK